MNERSLRARLIDDMLGILRSEVPKADLFVYGSHATGLATSNSDVDLGINFSSLVEHGDDEADYNLRRVSIRQILNAELRKFHRILSQHDQVWQTELVTQTMFPLVRATHKESNIEFQIVASRQGGSKAKLVQQYLTAFPSLEPVFLVTKTALEARGLSDPHTGGLTSYSLLVMIVAFLKMWERPGPHDPGEALYRFLKFFADFNTSAQCIAADPPRIFPKTWAFSIDSMGAKEGVMNNPVSLFLRPMSSVLLTDPRQITGYGSSLSQNQSLPICSACKTLPTCLMT